MVKLWWSRTTIQVFIFTINEKKTNYITIPIISGFVFTVNIIMGASCLQPPIWKDSTKTKADVYGKYNNGRFMFAIRQFEKTVRRQRRMTKPVHCIHLNISSLALYAYLVLHVLINVYSHSSETTPKHCVA